MRATRSCLVILLVLFVATAAGAVPPSPERGALAPRGLATRTIQYTPHSNISINGDAQFTAANGVVSGSGTASDPFIIQGWEIVNWSMNNGYIDGIDVVNTRLYFVIRDVYLHAGDVEPEPGGPACIYLGNVSNGAVDGAVIDRSWYGIYVSGSSDVSVLESNVTNVPVALTVYRSSNITVYGNALGANYASAWILNSDGVRFVGNNVSANAIGLNLTYANDTKVYHNNFIGNTIQAQAWQLGTGVTWDDGYPSGGNYWSDYTGVDSCSGPLQDDCSGSDGIGDTPYTLGVGGEDRYPLMNPWVSPSYVVHPPIDIEGDANFTAANGVVGGSGTLADPFVISGWQIDSATANAIEVHDTRASFVVRGVEVVDSSTAAPYNYAVYFANVTGAEVEYLNLSGPLGFWIIGSSDVVLAHVNQSSGAAQDLWLTGSHNVTVADSRFNGTGLFVMTSDHITVSANHLTGTQPGGVIKVSDSNHAVVDGNEIVAGLIYFNYTWDSTISNNRMASGWILLGWGPTYNTTVTGNALGGLDYGIDAWQAQDVLIGWNNVSSVGSYALVFVGVANATAVGNRISDSGHGLFTEYSQGLQIYHNDLVNNAIQAANLSSNDVFWNASYPIGGNYWSDYAGEDNCSGPLQDNCTGGDGIGDTPYAIGASDADAYPLMTFVGQDTTPPLVHITSPADGATSASSPIVVAGTASDQGGSGLRDVQIRVNGGSWSPVNGFETWNASVPLVPGGNVIEAQARDWAGNAASAEVNVTYPPPPPSNTPPVANFSWTPATGNASTVFTFTSTSADSQDPPTALQVRWDWEGDGTWDTAWSTNGSATHAFAIPGTYNVTIEVRDTGGFTGNKTYAITVTPVSPPPPPPLGAEIFVSPMSGTMPLTVTFNSTVTGGMAPYQYEWHLGDGSTSPAANTVHIYLTGGNFSVWLTVYDHGGASTLSNVLWVNVTPAAVNLSVVPILPTEFVANSSGITVSLRASVSGGAPPYTFFWTFGDGSSSTDPNPEHTYARAGAYNVTVTVTDSQDHSVIQSFTLLVPACTGCGLPSVFPFAYAALIVLGVAGAAALVIYLAVRWRKARIPP